MLQHACLEPIRLEPQSPATRKFIRELGLRTRTGASIVAIDRSTTVLVNPGPDEELLAGDQVLLLGTREHIEAARKELLGKAD